MSLSKSLPLPNAMYRVYFSNTNYTNSTNSFARQ